MRDDQHFRNQQFILIYVIITMLKNLSSKLETLPPMNLEQQYLKKAERNNVLLQNFEEDFFLFPKGNFSGQQLSSSEGGCTQQ